jgi:hypothetical protein
MSKVNYYLKYINKFFEEYEYAPKKWHLEKIKKLDKQEKTKLWNLFKKSYDYMKDDMIKGNSYKKFFQDYNDNYVYIIDNNEDNSMDAFIIYKKKNINGKSYRKISILATNVFGKIKLIEKIILLLKNKKNFFVEGSLKINNILDRNKIEKVQDEQLIKKIIKTFSNKDVDYLGDGKYSRKLTQSGKTIEKIMYGELS